MQRNPNSRRGDFVWRFSWLTFRSFRCVKASCPLLFLVVQRGSILDVSTEDVYDGSSAAQQRGEDFRRLDSDDEGYSNMPSGAEDDGDEQGDGGADYGHGIAKSKIKKRTDSRAETHHRQDPPARERPSDGAAWPFRETLSFTRSLVFYGAGSITAESEEACAHIQRCRSMRQKYQGSKGTIIRGGDVLMAKDITFRIGHEVRMFGVP